MDDAHTKAPLLLEYTPSWPTLEYILDDEESVYCEVCGYSWDIEDPCPFH